MDMRVKISRERFVSLSGNELAWELIQKVILPIRGKRVEVKQAVFERLTPGQKDLFGYQVLYGHTQFGWFHFYEAGYASHLPMIRKGLEHIQAQALIDNLDAAERLYRKLETQDTLEKAQQIFAEVDQTLFSSLIDASQKMEDYIRANAGEFVEFIPDC